MICLVRSHSGSFADVRSKTGWILFSTRRLVSLAMMAFERDSSIVASVAEVPFFGDRDNIAPRPLVWFFTFYEEAFGNVQYDIVQITSLNDFWRGVIRSSGFCFKYLRFCSF